jgi:hypothetical protein
MLKLDLSRDALNSLFLSRSRGCGHQRSAQPRGRGILAYRSPLHTMTEQADAGTPLHKGKARAINQEQTENTPLLASHVVHPDDESVSNSTTLVSTLTTVFLTTLFISILLILLLVSLVYSYAAKASQLSNDDIINSALVLRGPDALDVFNISEHGDVWLRIDGRVGFDAGSIIGLRPDGKDSFWLDAWKTIGRWGVRNLDIVSITLSSINITSQHDPPVHLASIDASPFQIPLTTNPPDDISWLTPISLPVRVRPSHNASAWLKFARESWRRGYVVAQATIAQAKIQGGPLQGAPWRNALKADRSNVTVGLHMKSMLHPPFIVILLQP